MVALKKPEFRTIADAFNMHGGYVLKFSNGTFAEFFEDEFGIEIYDTKYAYNGGSKAKHLNAFVETEDEHTVCRVLRRLWDHSEEIPAYREADGREAIKARLFALISKMEGGDAGPRTDAIERFKARDPTLEELVASIERDIAANRPSAALDRLHTYCMKKFEHLLDERGIPCDRSEALRSRVGKYTKALTQERELRDMTLQIVKNAFGVFDLLDQAEARFIFESVSAFLRFIKTIEASRFGA
ncbi:hypothetical protein [Azospirillum soli]|uniref:hypothetical protein n=1 Tax=Azospirillum soli TaxID=1304799 RepID=UPI001AE2EC33|nr:hypothetical protein [Azospirillum soli]MBP2315547.1 hypothetical protein [Azospirillum soli]